MLKKLCYVVILAATSTAALAVGGAPYLGGSVGILDTTTSIGSTYRGVPFTGFVGYGTPVNKNIYLGGEVLATLGTATLNNTSSTLGSMRTSYGYGASFIPGYLLTDSTMVFGRLGVVRSRFSDQDETVTGGQFGLGMQANLTQNWDLRGEYNYTTYASVNGTNPHSDLFNLGLVYKIQ